MYKPKNVSIKKLTQVQQQNFEQTKKNSRVNLAAKRDSLEMKPISKQNTFADENHSSEDEGDFIACINGYLHHLDSQKRVSNDFENIKEQIRKQKQINRSLQKNIIDFQKILWRRTKKLESLEESVRKLQENKQNQSSMNSMNSKMGKSRESTMKIKSKQNSNKYLQNIQTRPVQLSNESDLEETDQESSRDIFTELSKEVSNFHQRRRKTELPVEIEKMISKTIGMRQKKAREWHA